MTDAKRRILLKGSLAAGAVGFAIGSGLMTPGMVLAAWPDREAYGTGGQGAFE